jgi:hypothetical protein
MRRDHYPIMICALALAGCATTSVPEPVPVDTYCLTAKKRTWDINDTPETIRDVRAHNKTVDLRCGYPGKVAGS